MNDRTFRSLAEIFVAFVRINRRFSRGNSDLIGCSLSNALATHVAVVCPRLVGVYAVVGSLLELISVAALAPLRSFWSLQSTCSCLPRRSPLNSFIAVTRSVVGNRRHYLAALLYVLS